MTQPSVILTVVLLLEQLLRTFPKTGYAPYVE